MANRGRRQSQNQTNPFIEVPNPEDQDYNYNYNYNYNAPLSYTFEQENLSPTPQPPHHSTAAAVPSPTSGRHPTYHGIRCRGGKWVSEIREPRKTTRIWLGTYPTPEMAAAAYDVAALALKGPDAKINFPGLVASYPVPVSQSAGDIRAAAAMAAAAASGAGGAAGGSTGAPVVTPGNEGSSSLQSNYVDEEELFDMPQLMVDMAGGMLLSPPRAADDDEWTDNSSRNDNLWSYP